MVHEPIRARLRSRLAAFLTAAALLTAGPALAGSVPDGTAAGTPLPGPNLDTSVKKPAGTAALRDVGKVGALVEFGKANADAKALYSAAEALKAFHALPAAREKPAEEGGKPDSVLKAAGNKDSVKALLAQASALAKNDPELADKISKAAASDQTMGAKVGYEAGRARVRAYGKDIYKVSFRRGELAEVAIDGDDDTDLDLFIFDQNGNAVCASQSGGDEEYCSWVPKWTGPFLLVVVNNGGVSNVYSIAHN